MTSVSLAVATLRWLAAQSVAWVCLAAWLVAGLLERGLATVSIADLTPYAKASSYNGAFRAALLGIGLGLYAWQGLRPLWTRRVTEVDAHRCWVVLVTPAVLLLVLSGEGLEIPGALGARESLSLCLLLVLGCSAARLPASNGVRQVAWAATAAALLWLMPTWFSSTPPTVVHPLHTPILPIVGLMLALWLSAPHRGLDR